MEVSHVDFETILIADAGATKTDWVIATPSGVKARFAGPGLNPMALGLDEVAVRLDAGLAPFVAGVGIDRVAFYGAGCTPEMKPAMKSLLEKYAGSARVEVESDMLGAARSLCGHSRGIACILGTGSNSCLFDGEAIEKSVPALGYILGDEGSGAVIGRCFIGNLLKGLLPAEVCRMFYDAYRLTQADIMTRVYRSGSANSFLASFMPFVGRNMHYPEIESIVSGEFDRFIERNIMAYAPGKETPVCFTGSVACHFSSQLRSALARRGLACGKIEPAPIDGLTAYHIND